MRLPQEGVDYLSRESGWQSLPSHFALVLVKGFKLQPPKAFLAQDPVILIGLSLRSWGIELLKSPRYL